MMELLLDISWLTVTEPLIWKRVTILKFTSDASVRDGWWSGSAGFANVDERDAVDIFLEAVGRITKVLCSLLLRTCSKDIGATQSGQTTFGGETGPTPASQECRDTIKQRFLWSNALITLQYRNQTSQAVLLVGPFGFLRSFFTPSVMLGILMKGICWTIPCLSWWNDWQSRWSFCVWALKPSWGEQSHN